MIFPQFPFGPKQQIAYPANNPEITVDIDQRKYWGTESSGQGYLPVLGYERRLNPEHAKAQEITLNGDVVYTGPAHESQYLFEWKLQNLPPEIWFALWGIYFRQQAELEPVLLLDRRLAMQEANPRKRARVGVVSNGPSVPGLIYYWGAFHVFLAFNEADYTAISQSGLYELSFKGQEILPPRSPGQDLVWE